MRKQFVALLDFDNHRSHKGIGVVCNIKIDNFVLALFAGALLKAENTPPNCHRDFVLLFGQFNILYRQGVAANQIAVYRFYAV